MTIRCLSVALILAATPPAATAQNPWQGGIAPLAQQPARINREVRSSDLMERLTNPFFAFDNGTGRDQKLPLEEQAELVKRTGYAGLGYTGALRVPEMLQALESRGLKMFSIYVAVRVDGDKPSYDAALPEAIRQLKGHGTVIWLTVQGNSPEGEQRAVQIVREVADMAARSGLRVVLYPHMGFYVGRVEDALRIRKLVDRPNLGISFNLTHFLAVKDELNLDQRLREAMPYLELVSINGAEHEGGWDRLIQPLDRGLSTYSDS
jgi:sugar phosphate isomerase/epimerase